jgi:hypothetical protein
MGNHLAQRVNAERWLSREHDRLLSEGFTTDGHGMYWKESNMPAKKDWGAIARAGIERSLGDAVGEHTQEPTPDEIYDQAYTIAHDALTDAGCDPVTARKWAEIEARKVSNP